MSPSVESPTETLPADVVIIGGGVQGLWLLNQLTEAGRPAVLLERRELGGEQTCHSHVYLHCGYLYKDTYLVPKLIEAQNLWTKWLARQTDGESPCEAEGSCYGFRNPSDAVAQTHLWKETGLEAMQLSVFPPALQGSLAVTMAYGSPEKCLNGSWLVQRLRAPVEQSILPIESVEKIVASAQGERIEELKIWVPLSSGAVALTLRPQVLVLAAGVGNQALLDKLAAGDRLLKARVDNKQQIRKAFMLVVKGRAGQLPPLVGIFKDLDGLFLVSRVRNDEVVWLVSDHRSVPTALADDWIGRDAREWLPRTIANLETLAPRYFSDLNKAAFRWGVYDAPKSEGNASGGLPSESTIEHFRFNNLWAVWPTKLTLSPVVGRELTEKIVQLVPKPQSLEPFAKLRGQLGRQVHVAPERWEITPCSEWREFKRSYSL